MPDFWFQKCPASFIIDRENGSGKRLKRWRAMERKIKWIGTDGKTAFWSGWSSMEDQIFIRFICRAINEGSRRTAIREDFPIPMESILRRSTDLTICIMRKGF